jgi:hypothetical protein
MTALDLLVAKEGDDRFLPRSIRTPTDDDHGTPRNPSGLGADSFWQVVQPKRAPGERTSACAVNSDYVADPEGFGIAIFTFRERTH